MSSAVGRGVAGICDRALLFRRRAPVLRAPPSASPERSGRRKRRNGLPWWPLAEAIGYGLSWLRARSPSSSCLFHGPHGTDEGADLSGILIAWRVFDAGGNVHAPRMEKVDRVLHIARTQAASDDQLADAVDDSSPGLDAFPVESVSRAARFFRRRGIEQDARDHAGAEAVGFEEEVAVLGDVDFVHAFALISFVWLYQADRNRIPSHRLPLWPDENSRRPTAENGGSFRSVREFLEECAAKFHALIAAQLHSCETHLPDGVTHLVHGLVDENADFVDLPRHLGNDRAGGFQSNVARALRIEDEAQRVRARIGRGERVVEVRDPADFDPSHKNSCQLSAISSQ